MKKLLTLLLLGLLCACEGDKDRDERPESKGLPSELLVVLPALLQNGDIADSIQTIVDCDAPGLGSSERIFRTMTIGKRGYEKTYKLMHSQLHVELDPKQKTPALGVAYDVYARPQLQVVARAASENDMRRLLSQNRERLQRIIMDFQLDRQAEQLKRKYSKRVADDLRKHTGYSVCMPVDMGATKKGKNFLWGSSNRGGDKDINFVFYTYPWEGEDIADTALFVAKRDSVLRKNIPGSRPDQWMQTTRGEHGVPVIWPSLRRIQGGVKLEVRGLWEMHNGFMGGPFVSLVSVDTVARKVVVGEGFVFSPNTSKRDLLRSLESGLRTLGK